MPSFFTTFIARGSENCEKKLWQMFQMISEEDGGLRIDMTHNCGTVSFVLKLVRVREKTFDWWHNEHKIVKQGTTSILSVALTHIKTHTHT